MNESPFGRKPTAAECEDAFSEVVRSYASLSSLCPIGAANPDPNATKKRRGHDASNFLMDVERITERTLRGDKAAQDIWFALALEKPVEIGSAKPVVQRCGEAYLDAGITFAEYFKPSRGSHRAARV